jgi:hypothetical protein
MRINVHKRINNCIRMRNYDMATPNDSTLQFRDGNIININGI